MLTSPEQIQRQLSDAISIISKEDFPEKWENLLTDMVQKFNTGDFHIINGILRTAHSIFKRYRHEFQSNELWKEIKYVLSSFAVPFTNLFKVCDFFLFFKNFSNFSLLSGVDVNGRKILN